MSLSCLYIIFIFFLRYFNVAYPLPKMDHVGLPEMGPGAMENYGLIKYREKFVIVDEDAPPETKQATAFIFAHELGHQVGYIIAIDHRSVTSHPLPHATSGSNKGPEEGGGGGAALPAYYTAPGGPSPNNSPGGGGVTNS